MRFKEWVQQSQALSIPPDSRSRPDEVAEPPPKLLRALPRGGRDGRQSLRIFKVAALQPDHVMARTVVGFAPHIDPARLHAARGGVDQLGERQRLHPATDKADDRPG